MSDAQKTPLSRTLSSFATQKALDEIEKRGAPLPGHVVSVSGAIVTVNFDVEGLSLPQMTMPIIGAEYVRLPVQPGDKGQAWPSSVYLGGISGLGGGTADLTPRGNLSALLWVPVGSKSWSQPDGFGGAVGIDANLVTTGNVAVGNGASGTFTTGNGQTVDVLDGIIVNIY